MTIRIAIQHTTTYEFDRDVKVSPHILRLRPAPHSRTHIHGYSLKVTPEQHFINWQQDPFGNWQARLVFPEQTRKLQFAVEVIADMTVINPFDFFIEEYAETYPFNYEPVLQEELAPYLKTVEDCPELDAWMASIDGKDQAIVGFLVELNSRLAQDIGYGIRLEPGIQTCQETLTLKKVPVVTPLGCWCRSCAGLGWRLVLLLVIWCS
ncbi:transglutaminase N-terminal domain-containing protein [Shewanella dokdonensis]|uniref:transglutaminase N-terminal domain-containing protein n=1 Tax=Shewanella dokdonensis TaxID=712036 RepID=UPI001FD341EC|nr:transglutaminase N-terminal domain-containing protein [Shewanella dokdonensis]